VKKSLFGEGGEHDDGNILESRIVFEFPIQGDSTLLGHHDIEDDKGRLLLAGNLQTLYTVFRSQGFITARFQQSGNEDSHIQFIINDQNLFRHFRSP